MHVASRCGHWVWSLGRILNEFHTSLSFFYQLHHQPYIALNFFKNVFFCVISVLVCQRSYFLHNFNVMTSSEMYDRQNNNYLVNRLLLFAERLTNCKLSHRERRV